jgi:hypothetical protein
VLNRKLRGHDAYFGITGNVKALSPLRLRGPAPLAQVAQPPHPERRS